MNETYEETYKETLSLPEQVYKRMLEESRAEIEEFLERRRLAEFVSNQALQTRMTI